MLSNDAFALTRVTFLWMRSTGQHSTECASSTELKTQEISEEEDQGVPATVLEILWRRHKRLIDSWTTVYSLQCAVK